MDGSIRASGSMTVYDAPRGAGPYGIATTPERRGLLRLACRQLRGAHRRRDRQGDSARTPNGTARVHAASGRTALDASG